MRIAAMLLAAVATAGTAALGCRHEPSADTQATHEQGTALAVGARAPSAALTRPSGTTVAMADLIADHDETIVVFYRGFY